MPKITVISRVNPTTKKQIQKLAKNNHLTKSNIIRFILEKSLSNNPQFKLNLDIKRFMTLRLLFSQLMTDLNRTNSYYSKGFNNLNQISHTLNILIKNKSMTSDLSDYFVFTLRGLNLKSSYKTMKELNKKVDQIWKYLNMVWK